MNRFPLALAALLTIPSITDAAMPTDFRVVARIYGADQVEPLAEHLTLFDSGVAYELPQHEQRFITVFDPDQQIITLLDRTTQVQSLIKRDDLIKIVAQTRATVSDRVEQVRLGMLAQVESEPVSGKYRIAFGNFEYVATTQTATQPAVAVDFGRFVDLAARLNLVRRLGPPPFGRMTLNEKITADRRLPLELTRTVTRGEQPHVHRKTHQLTENLTEADRERIEQIQSMMKLYRHVPLEDFPR